jgi:hypothetical protein
MITVHNAGIVSGKDTKIADQPGLPLRVEPALGGEEFEEEPGIDPCCGSSLQVTVRLTAGALRQSRGSMHYWIICTGTLREITQIVRGVLRSTEARKNPHPASPNVARMSMLDIGSQHKPTSYLSRLKHPLGMMHGSLQKEVVPAPILDVLDGIEPCALDVRITGGFVRLFGVTSNEQAIVRIEEHLHGKGATAEGGVRHLVPPYMF